MSIEIFFLEKNLSFLTFGIGVDVALLVNVPDLRAGHDDHFPAAHPHAERQLQVLATPNLHACGQNFN